MKKIVLSVVLLIFASAVVFADQSDMYVRTLHIAKIYPTRDGYRVVYRMDDGLFSDFYVPMSWFDPSVGKAELVVGPDPSYPYFSIFWQDGKFDFVRLYVRVDPNDPSWGTLPGDFDLQGKFNITTLDLKWQ